MTEDGLTVPLGLNRAVCPDCHGNIFFIHFNRTKIILICADCGLVISEVFDLK